MNKAMVSFAIGEHQKMLEIAIPTFYKYSVAHNYDLVIPSERQILSAATSYEWSIYDRPVSWWKLPILKKLLQDKYDIIFWIDSDVVISKFDTDINQDFILNDQYLQSFVVHEVGPQKVPNCGIWNLKKSAIPLIDDLWKQINCINHGWWEQKANLQVMNWNTFAKDPTQNLSYYGNRSMILPYEFNVHKDDIKFKDKDWIKEGRMLHATMYSDRISTMREWINHIA